MALTIPCIEYAECCNLFNVMLNVVMLSVFMLSVIMLSVVMLSVVIRNVAAPANVIEVRKRNQ